LKKILPSRKHVAESLLVIAAVLFTAFLIYGPRWLSGEYIFTGVVQEQYYLIGQYAFDQVIIEEFSSGRFPLWNRYNALGTPLAGNMLSAAFYPLKILVYLWDSYAARDVYILLRLLLAGLFTFALARRSRLSVAASLCAALAFTFTGYFKMFINENYLNADVLLPGLVLLTLRLRDKPKSSDFVLVFALMTAVLLNGHPEAAFYTLLLPAFLVVATCGSFTRFVRTGLLFSAALLLALMAAMPMLLPFLEYWARGHHFHVPHTGFFHYPVSQIASVFSPWFFGQAPAGAPFLFTPEFSWPDTAGGVPPYGSTSVPWLFPSLGAVTVLLVVVGAARLRHSSRTETAMAAYALFFSGVMFGLPLFRLLGLLPVFSFSGNFKHPLPAVALIAALFAGKGFDAAKEREGPSRIIIITIYTALCVLLLGLVTKKLPEAVNYINLQSGMALASLIMAGAGLTLLTVKRKEGKGRPAFTAYGGHVLVIGALVFSLSLDGHQQPMQKPGYLDKIKTSKAVEHIEKEGTLERTYFSPETAPPNLFILEGLSDIRVMDGVNDRRLVKAINTINGHTRTEGGRHWYRTVGYLQPRPEKIEHPLLKLFNVRYAVMPGPLPYNTSIDRMMQRAQIVSPRPGFVGKTRLPTDGATAPGLLQHPPSSLSLKMSETSGVKVKLMPVVAEKARPRQKDGLWMASAISGRLVYARHLHPKKKPADETVEEVIIPVLCFPGKECRLDLYSLPCASIDYDQAGWGDFRLGGADSFDSGAWELVTKGREWLYRNPQAMPRVFMTGKAASATEDEALAMLAKGDFSFADKALVSGGDVSLEMKEGASGVAGQVESIFYSSQKITIEGEMFSNGRLVLADLYYPGWRCEVRGKERRIFRTDYLLRGVPLQKGDFKVEFIYRPWSFRTGLWLSICVLAVAVLFVFASIVRRSRTKPDVR